jgi:hypothetical protein
VFGSRRFTVTFIRYYVVFSATIAFYSSSHRYGFLPCYPLHHFIQRRGIRHLRSAIDAWCNILAFIELEFVVTPPPPCFIQTANNTPYRPRNPSASSHALKLQPIPAMGELIYSYTIIRFFPLYIRRMGTSMACFLSAVQLAWH